MTFDEFVEANRWTLGAYYILEDWFPGHFALERPYPPTTISAEEWEEAKRRLNGLMPLDSIIFDLWDWDLHFEEDLTDDWYLAAVFGSEEDVESCASSLAEYFLENVARFGMDYAEEEFDESGSFEAFVQDGAEAFIKRWREAVFDRFVGPTCSACSES